MQQHLHPALPPGQKRSCCCCSYWYCYCYCYCDASSFCIQPHPFCIWQPLLDSGSMRICVQFAMQWALVWLFGLFRFSQRRGCRLLSGRARIDEIGSPGSAPLPVWMRVSPSPDWRCSGRCACPRCTLFARKSPYIASQSIVPSCTDLSSCVVRV